MKYYKSVFFFIIALCLQPFFNALIGADAKTMNLFLALVLAFGYLYRDQFHALLYGTLSGVIYDFCSGEMVGMTAIPLFIVSIIIYFVANIDKGIDFVNYLITYAYALFSYYLVHFILIKIMGYRVAFSLFVKGTLMSGLLTLPVILLLYVFMNEKARKRGRRYY